LLAKGLVWRVGDGTKVDIWQSDWIPREGAVRPLGHKCLTDKTTVPELLCDQSSRWDEEKLQEIFHDFDVRDIKKVHVGGAGCDDYHAWNWTKNGLFSIKSAYHLCMKLKKATSGGVGSSSSVEAHKGWLSLWSAPVPGKVTIHVWRLVKNGLAVGSELEHRHIKAGVWCIACGREETATIFIVSGPVHTRSMSGSTYDAWELTPWPRLPLT
jgi:hypothetical protein